MSSNRRVFAILGGLLMAGNVSLAQISALSRPDVKTGDRWKIERRDPYTKALESTREVVVTTVSQSRVDVSINGEPGVLSSDLTILDSPTLSYDKGYEWLRFPLEPGKKWEFKTNWLNKPLNARGNSSLDVEVLSQERITVGAGSFDAIKLRATGYMNGSAGWVRRATVTYWYAPKAKHIIRLEWVDPKRDYGFIDELIEYSEGQ